MQAYIFVNTEPGKLWDVAENALKIEEVRMAHAVTGQYDVIIYAEFVSIDMLGKLIDALHALKGSANSNSHSHGPEAQRISPHLTEQ